MGTTVGGGGGMTTGNSSEFNLCWSLPYTQYPTLSRQAGKGRALKNPSYVCKVWDIVAPGCVCGGGESLGFGERVDCLRTDGSFSNDLFINDVHDSQPSPSPQPSPSR